MAAVMFEHGQLVEISNDHGETIGLGFVSDRVHMTPERYVWVRATIDGVILTLEFPIDQVRYV